MRYAGGNRIALLRNGEQYFPALAAAIDGARSEIFLESYLFEDDQTGSLIASALSRAAARGVEVHVLLDGFGARDFAPRLRAQLEQAGARLQVFRPVRGWWPSRGRLRRMHRKLVSVDAAIAFVGGINVIDDYDTPGQTPPRFDYAVRIEGPLVQDIRLAAVRLWTLVAWAALRRRGPGTGGLAELTRARARRGAAPQPGGVRAALVLRDSLRHRRAIEKAYLNHIAHARTEVVIACAYFFPGRRFRRALTEATRRGVRVVLLLQGRVEYVLLHYASRALYGVLLGAGIEIHEYHRSFLHAKVAVFDRVRASVGSSNIDPFSLLLAREANLFVDDPEFAGALRDSLEQAVREGARPVLLKRWQRLPLLQRVRIWIGYGVARLFLAYYGFDRYH